MSEMWAVGGVPVAQEQGHAEGQEKGARTLPPGPALSEEDTQDRKNREALAPALAPVSCAWISLVAAST